jgi:hypothetical protein
MPRILTLGFDGRLDGGNRLVAVDSGGGDFCSVHNGFEHGEANVEAVWHCRDTKMGSLLLL